MQKPTKQTLNEIAFEIWQAHMDEAKKNPGLEGSILHRCKLILMRLVLFYKRLRSQRRRTRRLLQRKLSTSLAGAALILALSNAPVHAAIINVDGTVCTLSDAITASNTDAAYGGCSAGSGADTIVLQAGSNHTLTEELPHIISQMTIEGNGATIERESNSSEFSILSVEFADLTLNNAIVTGGLFYSGGGIHGESSTVSINDSIVSGNTSELGGGIYCYECDMSINNSTIIGNTVIGNIYSDGGGGIAVFGETLTIENSIIANNSSVRGGGITHHHNGNPNSTVTIDSSTISGNTTESEGGGILSNGGLLTISNSTISGNTASHDGGGVFAYTTSMTINNSTISGNTTTQKGGGVFADYGRVIINNSTISGNTAGRGGGIDCFGGAPISISSTTITGNIAVTGGGIYTYYGPVNLANTLITGNQAPTGREAFAFEEYSLTSDSYNLLGFNADPGVSGFTPGATDIVPGAGVQVSDILNTTLSDNGGPTMTHALVTGSPAIDAIPGALCGSTADQRGISRPQGTGCDIGAFELEETADADSDGISDDMDNCPTDYNPDQLDFDGDGIGDICDNCPNDPDNDIDNDIYCGDIDNCPDIANPQQSNIDGDGQGDSCDPCPADPNNECDPNGSTAEEIPSEDGGTVETPNGDLTIDIDPGDLPEDITISVTQTIPQDPNVDLLIGPSPGLGVSVATYVLEPDGFVFENPVTITVTADVTHLNPNQRGRLSLYQWDEIEQSFVPVAGADCSVVEDPLGTFIKTCTAELDHFSVYAMVAPLDSDNDGIPDLFMNEQDNCSNDYNPNQEDGDEDEIGDVCDTCTDWDVDGYGREGLDNTECPNPEYDCNDLENSINPGTTKYTTVTYNGDFVVMVYDYNTDPPTGDVDISALLTDSVPQTISGWDVLFTINDVNGEPVADPVSITTDSSGTAYITIMDIPVGIYTIGIEFTGDDCYYYSSEDIAALAVCDPTGGFVTGGGWIESPPSAYTGDEDYIEGNANKATFGFVSKYKKGATEPTGETQFVFNDGNLHFHSDTYQWLVIAGARAQYKGTGTIKDRVGEYKFKLTGIDADINDADSFEVDRFRIKIWTEDEFDEETVIYDNSLGDDTDVATTEIGGGSIVIHK